MPRAATRDEEARHEKQVDDHNNQRERGESTQLFHWFLPFNATDEITAAAAKATVP
jgi:hypothetical protein